MERRHVAIGAIAGLALVACGSGAPVGPSDVEASAAAIVSSNGRSLNGRSLNGRSLNGRSLNGRSLNGISLRGANAQRVVVRGAELNVILLNATRFQGWRVKRTSIPDYADMDFVGATFQGDLSDGTTVPLRVDAIEPLPAPNADLLGYALTYETEEGWVPYCGVELDGTPALAIPMTGRWVYGEDVKDAGKYDDNADKGVTFACRHAAIAKCVELGYRPWDKKDGASLKPLTIACTRMLRADYCGTGVSYTLDGTLLDLDDKLSVQTVAEPGWRVEAAWGEHGAECIAPGNNRFVTAGLIPSCYGSLSVRADCGSKFDGPKLVVNRYAPQGQERFTGTWSGKADGWGRVWVSLRQTGEVLDGAYVTEKGSYGELVGTVTGRTLELTLTNSGSKDCTGTLMGDGLVDDSGATMAFDAAGSACKNPLTLVLTKQ